MEILRELRLSRKSRVVVLTGAGVSAESGVPIFRGKGSMWENPKARELARRAGPPWNTRDTWEFYEWRRRLVSRCEPNAAHLTLAEMEDFFDNWQKLHEESQLHTLIERTNQYLKVFQFLLPINRWASLEVMVTVSIRGKAAENLPKLWKELKKKL